MTHECRHPTFHGPTPEGNWVCNKCGAEVRSPVRDWLGNTPDAEIAADPTIPAPGTEVCHSELVIRGEVRTCELAPPHTGWSHKSGDVEWTTPTSK